MNHIELLSEIEALQAHPELRHYRFFGRHATTGLSCLKSGKQSNQHECVLGASGRGKTARFMMSSLIQRLIQGHDLWVYDFKSDVALLYTLWAKARELGIQFNYIDINPGRFSKKINLWKPEFAASQTLASRAETLAQGMGHNTNEGGDRAFYAMNAEDLLTASLVFLPEAETHEDVSRVMFESGRDKFERLIDEKTWRLTSQPRSEIHKLGSVTCLNPKKGEPQVSYTGDGRQTVNYITFDLAQSRTTGGLAAGLIAQNLFVAMRKKRPTYPTTLDLDDGGEIMRSSFLMMFLEAARSAGIQIVLSIQDMGQVARAGSGTLTSFEENFGLVLMFGPGSKEAREHLLGGVGTTTRANISWAQHFLVGFNGIKVELDPRFARPDGLSGLPSVNVSQSVVPTYDMDTISRLSAKEGTAWIKTAEDAKYAQYHGLWHPIETSFYMSEERYQLFSGYPYPGEGQGRSLVEFESTLERVMRQTPEPSPESKGVYKPVAERRVRKPDSRF